MPAHNGFPTPAGMAQGERKTGFEEVYFVNSSQIFIAFLCLIGYNDRCFLRALRFPTHKASKIKPLGFFICVLSNVTK
ncbi:hypothetical protein [Moraxella lacunata]|uniref:hypothetical protein n=1 Tax=Moraxella lacunata TaxID=477 RepID=UPI000A7D0ECB|nr:hypothetical protein [Moraxella lacunata]